MGKEGLSAGELGRTALFLHTPREAMMKLWFVLESHDASYADSINVAKGAFLSLTGREDVWDGHRWLWAVADDGREGWVPDDLITEIDDRPVASRDFSAIELTCSAGDAVDFLWETHG